MDEARLIDRLKLIERLFTGATTDGERVAAERARDRIIERLLAAEQEDPATEYRFSMPNMYARRVFVALCRRYGLEPYRYKRQRYTTVMLKVSSKFVDETLWPQYQQLSESLRTYLSEVTDRVVKEVLQADSSEATVVEEGGQLPAPSAPSPEASPIPAEATRSSNSSSQADPAKSSSDAKPEVDQTKRREKRREKRRNKKRNKRKRRK